ncbi:MAG: response regulator [Stigonema ocellatum SAG 48.90 = DSM 106950]|nr:response regulator [Stigonema ocellatum SAG 48.90 = DSM 106950]
MTKILVIENEVRTRNLFLECLKSEGFYTIGAENGLIGLRRAQEHLPDLVLCDVMMPELDGYGVLTRLRQDLLTAIIPFIFLTAKGTQAELRQGMNLGADDYLTKPCKVEELVAAITARLEKQTVLREWYATKYHPINGSQSTDTASLLESKSIFPVGSKLNKVFQYIEENYHQPINLRDVAQAVGYSTAYLTNLVKRQTQRSVHSWIVERRMVEARSLLLKTDDPVNQIAAQVGYPDAGHFIRQFRKLNSTSPKVWRNRHREQLIN